MIKVHEVKKDSQADALGLLAGDIIYEVNNTKIYDYYGLMSELAKAECNGRMIILRNDKPIIIELDLDSDERLGVSFEESLKKTKYKLNVSSMKILLYNFLWIVVLVIIYGVGAILGVESLFLTLGVLLYVFDAIRFIIDRLESKSE